MDPWSEAIVSGWSANRKLSLKDFLSAHYGENMPSTLGTWTSACENSCLDKIRPRPPERLHTVRRTALLPLSLLLGVQNGR